jgi:prepilin-type N-terminal cleavage/methylation domain-containing protein
MVCHVRELLRGLRIQRSGSQHKQNDMTACIAILRDPPRRQASNGFTLVELICVIVILGSLAASALPRYVTLADEAHHSVVGTTASSFQGAVSLANAACIVRDFDGFDNLPNFGAGNLDFNANCLPSSTNGNNNLNVNATRCMQIWNGILAPAPSISTLATDTTDYRAQGGGTTCTYTYREDFDTPRSFTYNAATGTISLNNP